MTRSVLTERAEATRLRFVSASTLGSVPKMAFQGLSQKIKQQYNAAIKNGSVLFTDSEVIELDDEQTQIPVSPLPSLCRSGPADDLLGSSK